MDGTEGEIWRMIPPEEKFEIMAQAQSKGVMAAAVFIVVSCTLAVGFKMSWLMWTSFIISPFVFQFAAGKAWRTLRPKILLEYLAARSASRRYAFSTRAKDLTPNMIFKGVLEEVYSNDRIQEAMEAMIANTKEAEVWITLFGDAFTMISERYGGAELKLASLLDDKLDISSQSGSGKDYGSDKELLLTVRSKDAPSKTYKLTSKYPAALVVFEKKVRSMKSTASNDIKQLAQNMAEPVAETPDDDKFNNLFSF